MYGAAMGTLNVYVHDVNDFATNPTKLWSKYGNSGRAWRLARATLQPTDKNFQVSYEIRASEDFSKLVTIVRSVCL